MTFSFETCGNAIIIVRKNDIPILATDPWLVGTAYFGSWAIDNPLTKTQIESVQSAKYLWISHGHPDHLHPDSLDLLPAGKTIFLPDHYDPGIKNFLEAKGFTVQILMYRDWFKLDDDIRICCMDNINQDAILVVDTSDGLLINKNDSPFVGEFRFLRKLVRLHPKRRSYLAALCAVDADMLNIVDANGERIIDRPEDYKKGTIWAVARGADKLGVGSFCCSSSQHLYVRADSAWANDYRIVWQDMKQFWSRPNVKLIQPYSTIDMATGDVTHNHPGQTSEFSRITLGTGKDNWNARLDEAEWARVGAFFRQFETLYNVIDFVALTVGGERRDFVLDVSRNAIPAEKSRGVHFRVPKQSLLKTVEYGYFDDLLIGNFMKTELINIALYPDFSPRIAKYGGNAKIFTNAELKSFHMHYFRRNALVYMSWRMTATFNDRLISFLRNLSEKLGVRPLLKKIYRRALGDPA